MLSGPKLPNVVDLAFNRINELRLVGGLIWLHEPPCRDSAVFPACLVIAHNACRPARVGVTEVRVSEVAGDCSGGGGPPKTRKGRGVDRRGGRSPLGLQIIGNQLGVVARCKIEFSRQHSIILFLFDDRSLVTSGLCVQRYPSSARSFAVVRS